jgi:beta-apo-4'-carotenal oxygenase
MLRECHRPYNFPIQLSIAPLVGAIASGCTAVVKPSEDTPSTSRLLHEIITKYLDQSCYICINGGVPETTALLAEKWDKIFFTGSQRVGKIIAAKAALSLTPVTLELGGLNPAIVTKSADPGSAARRLVFGKLLNAGQVCLSHNYTLLHRQLYPEFIESLTNALKEMYPGGAKSSRDFGRIVNKRNITRIKNMLNQSKGTILVGGDIDEERLFVEPTVVLVESSDDSLIAEESFGPLMPILLVDSTEEAISIANMADSSPLALSVFGDSEDVSKGVYYYLGWL